MIIKAIIIKENDMEEEFPSKIWICKCAQCKAKKQSLKSKTRKFFKRLTSKKRRKNKNTSFYYA